MMGKQEFVDKFYIADQIADKQGLLGAYDEILGRPPLSLDGVYLRGYGRQYAADQAVDALLEGQHREYPNDS